MAPLLRFVLGSLLALGAQGRQFQIPEVNAVVSQVLKEFSNYTEYHGPSGKAAAPTGHVDVAQGAIADPAYWEADISHQGLAPFAGSGYAVWRNVKSYGAKGDGSTDDTAAINAAIQAGGRCAPGSCASSTKTPAIVYFPAGTYIVSSPIVDYYFTQLLGNPNGRAVIQAASGFSGAAVIDADPYQSSGAQGYGSTNVFYRQIRNLVIDLTLIPSGSAATALHWPTAQATSLQNLQINLSSASGTQHVGVFIENGSAGFISDVVVNGGKYGFNIGNQQYTIRNVQINNAAVGINQLWSWGFTYKSLSINNCGVGVDMSALDSTGSNQEVGSLIFLDSSFSNTPVAIKTSHDTVPNPPSAGTLVLENVALSSVGTAVQGGKGATLLAGGSTTIQGWMEGHSYTPNGPNNYQGNYTPNTRTSALTTNGKYTENSKPSYSGYSTSQVLSARSMGAKGDGSTDDTAAVQKLLTQAAANSQIAFFDAGIYKVSSTIYMPPNSRVVGESYPVIMSSGGTFSNMNSPTAVVQVGHSGDSGLIQWADMIVATQGSQGGATLIEWNMAASAGSGMWDVHTRIGGFQGSNLQVAQCPTSAAVSSNCYGAFMSLHVTKSASGVYLENNWLWTADHDIDDPNNTQISIYTGRGLLWESTSPGWLYGTAVEHHSLYQYQFSGASNVVMGYIQTETPYYQPSPDAKSGPYPAVSSLNDPNYNSLCTINGNCDAFGLRIINSQGLYIYGAGLYSFFNHYSTTCSNGGGPENCQSEIFDLENSSKIYLYDLNTVGTTCMIYQSGSCIATYSSNVEVYPDTIGMFQSG